MEEIVKKLVSRPVKPGSGGAPSGLQPNQDREIRIVIEAGTGWARQHRELRLR
jgi:hypothetical protein